MNDMPESLRPFFLALDPYQQRAALLLVIANASADPGFKSRYRRRWWQLLEERAKLAALTSASLIEWSSSVSSRLGGEVARNERMRGEWRDLVRAGDDARVLDAFETTAPALVAFVRAWSDVRREVFEAEAAEMRRAHRGDEEAPTEDELPL